MYMHSSTQRNIHKTATEHGWRLHTHQGGESPLRTVFMVEYRRGSRDRIMIFYGTDGRLLRASAPTAYLDAVRAVQDYLARPFRGRAAGDIPAAPGGKRHMVAVWDTANAFTDAADARAFEDARAAAGDLVTVFEWRLGVYMQVREHNGQK